MTDPSGLTGLTVALFESRMTSELSTLVQKQGGIPLSAPAIVEAPLAVGPEIEAFLAALVGGEVDALLVLTGAGHRKLVKLLEPRMSASELSALLRHTLVAARGPKAVGALRENAVPVAVTAPAPHTWEDLLTALTEKLDVKGKRIALQQYGVPHGRLTRALEARGASVMQVPVYRWQLPEDRRLIVRNVEAICAGDAQVVLFTSAPQAGALIEVAREQGREAELREALTRCVVGSVGPSCTEGLKSLELSPDLEPSHVKMGPLVLEAARNARTLLAAKRGQ